MKTFKQKTSLALDILIAVMVFFSWLCMIMGWGNNGTIAAGGFRNLKYFTVLSNLLAGSASVLNIIFTIRADRTFQKIPSWVYKLRYAGAAAVALTFLVVIAFLWPVFKIPGLFSGANLFFHVVVPILAFIGIVMGKGPELEFRDSFPAALPMLIYGTGYILNNLINGVGEWPDTNDWYGFISWGWGPGICIFGFLILVTWGTALLMRVLHNRISKRTEDER